MRSLEHLLDRLLPSNEPIALIALGLAAAILVALQFFRGWYFWHERSLLLTAKRQDLLLSILKSEQILSVNPLRLETAFARAYGFHVPSTELRFAFGRDNTHRLLISMRKGRRYVRFAPTKGQYEPRGWMPIQWRVGLAVILLLTTTFAIMGTFLYGATTGQHAIWLITAELLILLWIAIDGTDASTSARSLLDMSEFPAHVPPAPVPQPPRTKSSRKQHTVAGGDAESVGTPSQPSPAVQ